MKKIIYSFVVIVSLLFTVTPIMAAETPVVTFDGTTSLKYSVDTSEFSQVFEGMVPSESRTLDIQLKNTSHKDVDFYMSTEVLKAFEDTKTATGGAYKVSLSLTQKNQKTLIYGQEEGALIGANENGFYDLNGSLSDQFMVASIPANEDATISLTIAIDGMSVRNEYQGLPALFQFGFSAQYQDTEANVIINKIINTSYVDRIIKRVQTGDPTTIGMIVGMLVVAGIATGLLMKRGGKKNGK